MENDRPDRPLKLQLTATGYVSWALREYMRMMGQTQAEVGKMVLDRWSIIDKQTLAQLEITHARYDLEVTQNKPVAQFPVGANSDRTEGGG